MIGLSRILVLSFTVSSVVGGSLGAQPVAGSAPDGEAEVVRQAEEAIRAGRYDLAAERLMAVEEGLSATAEALLGRALALDRRYVAAEPPLESAVERGQKDPQTLFFLGSTLWENGKLGEAEGVFETGLEVSSRHPAFLQQLGRLALWRGRYEAALALLEEALERAPGELDTALDWAQALEGAKRLEPAIEAYRAVVAAAPDHTQAHYGLGRVLVSAGRSEEGRRELELYRRLYEAEQERGLETGRRQAEVARGFALVHAGEAAAAVAHLRGLPESVDTLAALATALAAAGRTEESLSALERAVALAPERGDLRARLSEARLAGAVARE